MRSPLYPIVPSDRSVRVSIYITALAEPLDREDVEQWFREEVMRDVEGALFPDMTSIEVVYLGDEADQ